MRFAFSAMAATSGLLLLGLAFYGQPAVYLQQLRDEFAASPAADLPEAAPLAEADRDAVDDRMAALQQQVARLRNELAAKQILEQQTATATQPKPDQSMQPVVSEPVPAPAPPPALKPAPSTVLTTQPSSAVTPPAVQTMAGASAQQEPGRVDAPLSVASAPASPAPVPVNGQRRDVAVAEITPARPAAIKLEPPKPAASKTELAKLEPAKADAVRSEAGRPVPQKPTAAKAPPPTPPLPASPRQDVDDTQSVLARLRQTGPAVQQSDSADIVELRQAEPRPPLPPPSLPKLNSARAALAAGRVDDARRLLQEAQLQLVFRPVNATGDEQPLAGKGAADVAHALEALSANNIPLSRRYIDVAADDLSGRGTNASPQALEMRTTGYAPAYPPR